MSALRSVLFALYQLVVTPIYAIPVEQLAKCRLFLVRKLKRG
jgi:hypothetical protein